MKTSEIRKRFLDFFKSRSHTVVKSDSLVPTGDPSLLFTGAGMNQFKDYFLGVKKDMKRAVSSQKCLRTGDLDRVGETPYHHSFFEMLGNFSFGDYFKKEAIEWAWEFLTKELKIASDQLFVSVHTSDDEAFDIWTKHIGLKPEMIAKMGDESNFWPANAPKDGPNGPCGPCSEIYFDQGDRYKSAKNVPWYEDESGRFAEIWNLVFTQFNRQSDGSLKPLAAKNIDTGSGLERVACVLQGKKTNYEIDLFEPLLRTMKKEFKDSVANKDLYAILDHGRAVTFSVNDGVFPSNEGRGYVIRKLIRRSVWKAQNANLHGTFLYKIVPAVVEAMSDQYPEIGQNAKSISDVIRQEEEHFLNTLDKGVATLEKTIKEIKNQKGKVLRGENVFLLYDTYGFPDELTRIIAQKAGLEIDQTGFDRLMNEQRQRAKEKSKIAAEIFSIDRAQKEISHLSKTKFVGYDTLVSDAEVLWFKEGEQIVVVLDQSPFYPEGGGQVGDRGTISGPDFEMIVSDTQKKDQVTLHLGKLTRGTLKEKATVKAVVDPKLRHATKRNHTATHLLHAALRKLLGNHVRQVGSLVNPEKFRFDFTHPRPLSREEIAQLEEMVNAEILENKKVEANQLSYAEATKGGALAFFGDKYGETVRVIDVPDFSKELCGGTHCTRTGDIGAFTIVSESAIASGTRRIEAMTGLGAIQYLQTIRKQIKNVSDALRTTPEQLSEKIQKLQNSVKEFEKKSKNIQSDQKSIDLDALVKSASQINGVQLISGVFQETNLETLRFISDNFKKKSLKSSVVSLFGIEGEKVSIVVALSDDLKKSALDAGVIVKEISKICDGSGGGRKDLAQGGGKNPKMVKQAIEQIAQMIKKS